MSSSAGGPLARPPSHGRSSPRKGSSSAQKWDSKDSRSRLGLSPVGKTLSRKRSSSQECAKEFRRLGVDAGLFTFTRSRHVQGLDLVGPAPIPYRGKIGLPAQIHHQTRFIVFRGDLDRQRGSTDGAATR